MNVKEAAGRSRFRYSHKGRQFFFVTFTVAGRRPALSSLVEGEAKPRLSRLGRLTEAALHALHAVKPAVGVAELVIMPDHVHFLMIVNYELDRQISSVYLAKRVLEAVELAAAAGVGRPNGLGAQPPVPRAARAEMRELTATMVDYLREAMRVCDFAYFHGEGPVGATTAGSQGLHSGMAASDGLGAGAVTTARGGLGARVGTVTCGGLGAQSPVRWAPAVFDRFIWVELSYSSSQLKTIRNYIKLNPARYFWKLRHADRFKIHRGLKAKSLARVVDRLPYGASLRFDGVGALTLLASPFLFHVRLTLKKTVAEHEAAIAAIVEHARRGAIPVSGFISPGEKEALRRLKLEPRARLVKLVPEALPPGFDPSAEDSRELATGRLAIVSAFPELQAISALDMRRFPAAARTFRANCLRMNEVAAALCDWNDPSPAASGVHVSTDLETRYVL